MGEEVEGGEGGINEVVSLSFVPPLFFSIDLWMMDDYDDEPFLLLTRFWGGTVVTRRFPCNLVTIE